MDYGEGIEAKTAARYQKEWEQYVQFCVKKGVRRVPGRDIPWRITELKQYLWWRASSNNVRTVSQIKSMLKHCTCYRRWWVKHQRTCDCSYLESREPSANSKSRR